MAGPPFRASPRARAARRDAQRGDATRAALIDAGIRIFGRDGFLAATTKAIAIDAGVNQALISYYFGGKEGLYRAVVERIVDEIEARIGPVAAKADAARREMDAAGRFRHAGGDYLEPLLELLDRFVDVLTADESAAWAKIIVREQQAPSPAFDILYERLQGRFLAQLATLAARVRGRASPSAADRLAVLTIMGQVLVFRVARAAALRFTGWESMGPQQTARIKKQLRRNAAAVLEAEQADA